MNDLQVITQESLNKDKVSYILKNFFENFHGQMISIGDLRDAISSRSYGIFMLILSFPCIIPIPTPGLSAVIGAPLIIIALQSVMGSKTPWLPKFILKKQFKREDILKAFKYILPYLEKLESVLKPRLEFLVTSTAERLLAVLCFVLAVAIILPIPFGNALPAFIICLLSMAILTRDGLLVIIALTIAALGITALSTIIVDLVESISNI